MDDRIRAKGVIMIRIGAILLAGALLPAGATSAAGQGTVGRVLVKEGGIEFVDLKNPEVGVPSMRHPAF